MKNDMQTQGPDAAFDEDGDGPSADRGFGRIYNPAFLRQVSARRAARARGEREAEALLERARGEAARIVADAHASALAIRDEATRLLDEARRARAAVDVAAATATTAAVPVPEPAKRSARSIMLEVAARHGLGVEDLTGPRRSVRLVEARHEAMAAVATERPDMSLVQIGRIFGKRDHTTVFYALGKRGVKREGEA